MAYYQARSGVCSAGVTYTGWTPSNWQLKVNGTSREIQNDGSFIIEESLNDSPSRMTFTAHGYTPAVGNSVTFAWATPDAYYFAGTIIRRSARLDKDALLKWRCECIDHTWLMDRYARVNATYASCGINSALRRILDSFTDGGFTVGYVPSTMGDLDATGVTFEDATVSSAISRLAEMAAGYWFVDANKQVSIFSTLPDGTLTTIGNTANIRNVLFDEELSQIRTRTRVIGGGGSTTATVSANATTIPVDETRFYAVGGGTVRALTTTVTYTGLSTNSGPGSLTGCSGIIDVEIPQGTPIKPMASADNGVADLATILGGSYSGIALHVIRDDRLTDGECVDLATADVGLFNDAMAGVEYDIIDRVTSIGKTVTINITSPITVNQTFRVQSVALKPRVVSGSNPDFTRRVSARVFLPRIANILQQVA